MPGAILLIEDDRDIRKNVSRLLTSEGYIVAQAENGQVALDYLNRAAHLPNLIILDLMMPVMDGFEFRTIQEGHPRFSKIPVIIMTADGHLEEKKFRTSALSAIQKPPDIDLIMKAVRQVC